MSGKAVNKLSEFRSIGDYVFEEMKRLLKNHRGIYGFEDGEVVKIKEYTYADKYSQIKLYNFAVEGDESYVANGVLVHNCRCDLRTKKHKDDVWDEKRGMYIPAEPKQKSEGKIKIQVGDKVYEV